MSKVRRREKVHENRHRNQNYEFAEVWNCKESKAHLVKSSVPSRGPYNSPNRVSAFNSGPPGTKELSALERGPSHVGQAWLIQSSSNLQKILELNAEFISVDKNNIKLHTSPTHPAIAT